MPKRHRNARTLRSLLVAAAAVVIYVQVARGVSAAVVETGCAASDVQQTAPDPRPSFASASITPNTAAAAKPRNVAIQPGGRVVGTNVTLRQLIEAAYRRHPFDQRDVAGGPAWLDSDRFDLVATAADEHSLDPDGSPRQTWLMLRALVADRFKLRVHEESRQVPVYALVMATSDGTPGPRLRKAELDCGTVMKMSLKGEAPKGGRAICGQAQYPRRLVASAVSMPSFASILSGIVDRVVVDRTGLAASFDVEVEAVEIQPRGPFGPSYRPSDTDQSIFTSLPEQLGLKLEPTVGAVEIVVVDHAERPAQE